MKEILNRIGTSCKHLKIIDDFLIDNDTEYKRMEEILLIIDGYEDFCRELYFGGSKSKGNPPHGSRQMILSDIFQHIITSRGIYLAAKDGDSRKKFIKIVMYLVNQWLIMDCFGPRENLQSRRDLMIKLRTEITDEYFFENNENYFIEKYQETFDYDDDIIPNSSSPNRVLDHYDSLFPKIRGGPTEILVYLYLFQKRLGFVVSALTQQRLITGSDVIAPPDIFLFRRKGEVFGLEIGRGKEQQSADFSLLTGIPTVSVNIIEKQPFRCDSCGRWIIFCKKIIEDYSEFGIPLSHDVACPDCPYFDNGSCPDIMCHTEDTNRFGNIRLARYHLRCLSPAKQTQSIQNNPESLVAYFPLVEGLEKLPEE